HSSMGHSSQVSDGRWMPSRPHHDRHISEDRSQGISRPGSRMGNTSGSVRKGPGPGPDSGPIYDNSREDYRPSDQGLVSNHPPGTVGYESDRVEFERKGGGGYQGKHIPGPGPGPGPDEREFRPQSRNQHHQHHYSSGNNPGGPPPPST